MEPASIRYNNPGAMWGGNALTKRWGETGNIALNDGLHQNNHIAVFPDKVRGAAAQFDLWHTSQNYHGQQLAHAIRTWSGGNSWLEYVKFLALHAPGLSATTVIDDKLLSGPLGLALVKAQAQIEAGKPYPLSDDDWVKAQQMVFASPAAVDPQAMAATKPLPGGAHTVSTAPIWYTAALKEIGQRESPGNTGPVVRRYIAMSGCGNEGDPWCAIFANAMLESSGIPGTKSPSSQSFRHHPNFVKLSGPALGCIVVYWRISQASGLGHVGFYGGEDSHGFIDTVGGNESDMVRAELLNPAGRTFGLVGYYWPVKDKSNTPIPLPQIGKLPPQIFPDGSTGKVS